MPKLTERRHLQTRAEIANAAVELFGRNGFEDTTMTQVAEAAGVSRRTVYRHFPTKDELVFEYPRRWFEQLEHELSTREPGESLRDLSRRVLLSISEAIQDNRDDVLAAFSILQSTGALRGTHGKSDDRWINRYVEMFMAEPDFDPQQLQQVAVVAAATVSGTNTAIALWALDSSEARLTDITASVLDQLDPIWPERYH